MSVNALMRISNAKGESKLDGFKDWIEIQAWDWEVEAETSWTKGGGASVGKPNPGKMNWEHYFDRASITLLQYIFTGAAFEEIELRMFKGTGGVSQTTDNTNFFSMFLKGAFMTKVSNSATEEGNVLQKVEMVFKEITIKYKPQDDGNIGPKGQITGSNKVTGKLGAEIAVTWDIPGGKVS